MNIFFRDDVPAVSEVITSFAGKTFISSYTDSVALSFLFFWIFQ